MIEVTRFGFFRIRKRVCRVRKRLFILTWFNLGQNSQLYFSVSPAWRSGHRPEKHSCDILFLQLSPDKGLTYGCTNRTATDLQNAFVKRENNLISLPKVHAEKQRLKPDLQFTKGVSSGASP
jgi:hypothetical protein